MSDESDESFSAGDLSSWINMADSDYAKVIFLDVSDNYPSHENIKCHFQITDSVKPQEQDYVGLFPVGWKDISDCLASKKYKDAVLTSSGNYFLLIFKAEELPKDELNFYQFFYLTEANVVCGASTPFQLHASNDDLIAVTTEDDFLVVRSKLFEKNADLKKNLKDGIERIRSLENEKQLLLSEIAVVKKMNTELRLMKESDFTTIQELSAKLASKEKDIAEQMTIIQKLQSEMLEEKVKSERLKTHIDSLVSNKEKICKILEIRTCEKENLQSTVDSLKREREVEKSMSSKPSPVYGINNSNADTEFAKVLKEIKKLQLLRLHVEEEKILLQNQLEDTKAMLHAQEDSKILIRDELSEQKLKYDEIERELKSETSDNAKLKKYLEEKETELQLGKEECVKKEAVIDYLQFEKERIRLQKEAIEGELKEMQMRLHVAAELYKSQYIEIMKLKKQMKKTERSSKQTRMVESSVDMSLSGAKSCSMEGGSSDSDTGEHVSRSNNIMRSKIPLAYKDMLLQNMNPSAEKPQLQHKFPAPVPQQSMNLSAEKPQMQSTFPPPIQPVVKAPVMAENPQTTADCHVSTTVSSSSQNVGCAVHQWQQQLSVPSAPQLSSQPQKAPLTRTNVVAYAVLNEDLITFTNGPSAKENEGQKAEVQIFSLPCPACEKSISVLGDDTKAMILHLEAEHNQQLCPICGCLFDLSLPPKYYKFHVESHFVPKP